MICEETYEPDNGEYVSPCHLELGHSGPHAGYCLGSKALWSNMMTEAQYVKDRNGFGPTSDSKDKMPEGNVRIGGNIPMADRAPNYYLVPDNHKA